MVTQSRTAPSPANKPDTPELLCIMPKLVLACLKACDFKIRTRVHNSLHNSNIERVFTINFESTGSVYAVELDNLTEKEQRKRDREGGGENESQPEIRRMRDRKRG